MQAMSSSPAPCLADSLPACTPPLDLADNEVHLWWAPSALPDAQALAQLAPDEHAQARRFVFAQDQHRHLATRWLLRSTLSRYAAVCPDAWRFTRNAWGRPRISGPAVTAPLHFSLSHSGGWVVLAVARFPDVGVDIEGHAPDDMDGIVRGFFTAAEVDWWWQAGASPAGRRQRFLTLWTLKEAYVKARGRGLSLPLQDFSVLPDADGQARLHASGAVDAGAGAWRAWHGAGPDGMAVAVLMRAPGGPALALVHRQPPWVSRRVQCLEPVRVQAPSGGHQSSTDPVRIRLQAHSSACPARRDRHD